MALDFGSSIGITYSGTTVLTGNSAGFLKPLHPSFSARGIQGAVPQGNYIIFNTVNYNVGNYFNASNGLFTAPVAGIYCFFGHFLSENATAGEYRMSLYKNGGMYGGGIYIMVRSSAAGWYSMISSAHMSMAINDTVGLYYIQGANTHTNGDYCAFGGYLIG